MALGLEPQNISGKRSHSHLAGECDGVSFAGRRFAALGDAYEKDGNRTLAVINYERALQLDPENAHGADALQRLKK